MFSVNLFDRILLSPEGEGGSSDAGAPAPSSTPSSGETPLSGETNVPGIESPGSDFDGLGGFDEIEVPAEVAAPPTPAPVKNEVVTPPASAAPQQAPQAQAPAPPVQAATPPQPAPQETPQVAQAAPGQPASVPADAASLLKEFDAHREGLIEALAADPRFGLTADEATMLETEPAKAVPKLLARTYFMAMNAALTHINNLVPNMITRHVEATRVQSEREGAFYKKFPALQREKHHNEVMNFARVFRQQDPNMGFDDLTSLVGAAVMAKYGIAPGMVANGGHAPASTGVQPAAPAPFVPARPGVSVQTTPLDDNPFMGLGADYDE